MLADSLTDTQKQTDRLITRLRFPAGPSKIGVGVFETPCMINICGLFARLSLKFSTFLSVQRVNYQREFNVQFADMSPEYDTIRYEMRCYFNVR